MKRYEHACDREGGAESGNETKYLVFHIKFVQDSHSPQTFQCMCFHYTFSNMIYEKIFLSFITIAKRR